MDVTLRESTWEDLDWLMELRAEVLRADLERLGRYDAPRVRRRLADGFSPERTQVIQVGSADVGSITLRDDGECSWVEHFYLSPEVQGQGVGGRVLGDILSTTVHPLIRLNVLQGSSARRLYERHGFVLDHEDDVDVFMSLRR